MQTNNLCLMELLEIEVFNIVCKQMSNWIVSDT